MDESFTCESVKNKRREETKSGGAGEEGGRSGGKAGNGAVGGRERRCREAMLVFGSFRGEPEETAERRETDY